MNKKLDTSFQDELVKLKNTALSRNKKANFNLIKRAFLMGELAHRNQFRKSGEPYFIHPIYAAITLAENDADAETIAAALLHDVLEDTKITGKELQRKFGKSVYSLVKGVTKLKHATAMSRERRETLDLTNTILASTKDVRVLAIKLADKLHNIKTLQYLQRNVQKGIAKDALEVYAPLAYMLGMGDISQKMEDECFRILYPGKYLDTTDRIEKKRIAIEPLIKRKTKILKRKLRHIKGIKFVPDSKGVYELYCKVQRKSGSWDQIYDAQLLKIVTKDISECYYVLGVVHQLFTPLHRKLKDFIAIPRQNGYRALHTTVIGPKGKKLLKIYITTELMDKQNNNGVLATLRYEKSNFKNLYKHLLSLLSSISTMYPKRDEEEIMRAVRFDLLEDKITVFSPKGEAIELPENSTVLDYMYLVLPRSADKSWKARINAKVVGLDTVLKSGDLVEVVFSKQKQISRAWLSYVKTLYAKNSIRKYLDHKETTNSPLSNNQTFELIVSSKDREGLIQDITKLINRHHLALKGIVACSNGHSKTISYLSLGGTERKNAEHLANHISKMCDVSKVQVKLM